MVVQLQICDDKEHSLPSEKETEIIQNVIRLVEKRKKLIEALDEVADSFDELHTRKKRRDIIGHSTRLIGATGTVAAGGLMIAGTGGLAIPVLMGLGVGARVSVFAGKTLANKAAEQKQLDLLQNIHSIISQGDDKWICEELSKLSKCTSTPELLYSLQEKLKKMNIFKISSELWLSDPITFFCQLDKKIGRLRNNYMFKRGVKSLLETGIPILAKIPSLNSSEIRLSSLKIVGMICILLGLVEIGTESINLYQANQKFGKPCTIANEIRVLAHHLRSDLYL